MKRVILFVFSVIFVVVASAALLCGIELVLTASGIPLLPQNFWEQKAVAEFLVESETETAEGFLSGLVVLMGLVCVVLHVICSKIGKSLVDDGEDVRANMGISRAAHLIFVLSVPTLILDYIFRGVYDGGFILTCVMFGIPWLIFSVFTVPMSVSILLNDELYEGIPFSGGSYSSSSSSPNTSYKSSSQRAAETYAARAKAEKQAYDAAYHRRNQRDFWGDKRG